MAGSVNKVILVGNLGKDPEVRSFPNGGRVANFSIATSESWKDKATGEKRSKLKVQADRVQFLGGRDDAGGQGGGGDDDFSAPAPRRSAPEPRNFGNGPSRGGYSAPAPARRPPAPPVDNDADDDDIPF